MTDHLLAAVSRLESVTTRLEKISVTKCDEKVDSVMSLGLYDGFIKEFIEPFSNLSRNLGGDVATMGAFVFSAFAQQREFLNAASQCSEPSNLVDVGNMLQPTAHAIQQVIDFREKKRRSEHFNHLAAVSEAIGALGWKPNPAPYVKEMSEAAKFYTNKILMEFKQGNKPDAEHHVEWARAWNAALQGLHAFVKDNHLNGLKWGTAQGSSSAHTISNGTVPPPSGAAPPPLPPPGPPPPPLPMGDTQAEPDVRGALFADLNKGGDVTKGLKKVTADMQTHKNPSLKATGPVPPTTAKPTSALAPKPFKATAKPTVAAVAKVASAKPPVFELQGGKKWAVEHHTVSHTVLHTLHDTPHQEHQSGAQLTVSETDRRQTVYMYQCTDTAVTVRGKVNSVIMVMTIAKYTDADSCKKCIILVEDCISMVEFVNCKSVKGQVTGTLPTISIDKTDGCQFYLSLASRDAEVVSAKSSEMNLLVPTDDGADFVEYALPEQFKSQWNGKGFTTGPTDIAA